MTIDTADPVTEPASDAAGAELRCCRCGKPLPSDPFSRRRRFCSQTCNNAWWGAARRLVARQLREGALPDTMDEDREPAAPGPVEPPPPKRGHRRQKSLRGNTRGMLMLSVRPRGCGRPRRIYLEAAFWRAAQDLATARHIKVGELLDEAHRGHSQNLAMGIRLLVLKEFRRAAAGSGQAPMDSGGSAQAWDESICHGCGGPLPAGKRHGSERKFCSTRCRSRFWSAARSYVDAEVKAGRLAPSHVMAAARTENALDEQVAEVAPKCPRSQAAHQRSVHGGLQSVHATTHE